MSIALAIPLIFGGLSTSSPVYQRSIAIGQFAGQMAAQQAAAAEEACMSGTPLMGKKRLKRVTAASKPVQAYWKAVTSGKPANLASLAATGTPLPEVKANFVQEGNAFRWTPTLQPQDRAALSAWLDPFVASGYSLAPASFGTTLAGDGKSATIIWPLLDQSGRTRARYAFRLVWQGSGWRMTGLDLHGPGQFIEPPAQYCHAEGDVTRHLITKAGNRRRAAVLSLASAEAKAWDAEAAAAALQGKDAAAYALAQEAASKARREAEQARYAAESAEASETRTLGRIEAEARAREARRAAATNAL